jgi:hypothetical protein
MKESLTMKRMIMLIEVDDEKQQDFFYDVLQEMIEDRSLAGYFTLVDTGERVRVPDYMEYEGTKLIPAIVQLEKDNESEWNISKSCD